MIRLTPLVFFFLIPHAVAQNREVYVPKTLQECQERFQKWQDWYNDNKAKQDAAVDAYFRLELENKELRYAVENQKKAARDTLYDYAAFGVAMSLGCFILWLLVQVWRWLRPATLAKKRLLVSLACSAWLTFAAGAALAGARNGIDALARFAVLSLPALSFGAVAFWWFGQKANPPALR